MIDPDNNTFTQKDLLQHLLHAAQHSVTREEMIVQFSRAEKLSHENFEQFDKMNAERFKQVDNQFEQIEQRFKSIDKRFELIDKRFELIDKRFESIDKRFESIDKRFEKVDIQFEKSRLESNQRFDIQHQAIMDIHREIKLQMRWSFGVMITVGALVVGVLRLI